MNTEIINQNSSESEESTMAFEKLMNLCREEWSIDKKRRYMASLMQGVDLRKKVVKEEIRQAGRLLGLSEQEIEFFLNR